MASFLPFKHYSGPISDKDPLRTMIPDASAYGFDEISYCTLNSQSIQSRNFDLVEHRCLWNYWKKMKGICEIPIFSHIDPLDFSSALGHVMMVEPNADHTDYKFRVYGSKIVNISGRDMTGKWVSELPAAQSSILQAQYVALHNIRKPLYSEHLTYIIATHATQWCRLILPMESALGKMDRILVGNVACAVSETENKPDISEFGIVNS